MIQSPLPCCYYPTKTVFIDDSENFLDSVVLSLDDDIDIITFRSPKKATNYLKEHKNNAFIHEPFSLSEVNLLNLHQQLYNAKRFDEIFVVFIDYDMPSMNGLEVCRQLKGKGFKFVMLTGMASDKSIIKAFNEGAIDRYIEKSSFYFDREVNNALSELQMKQFQELSSVILQNRELRKSNCFHDEEVASFFKNFCEINGVYEYYLIDDFGSFLTLDFVGNPSWFTIKDEACLSPTKWEEWRQDAIGLKTVKNQYYYSWIRGEKAENHHVDVKKIVSYKDYLEVIQNRGGIRRKREVMI